MPQRVEKLKLTAFRGATAPAEIIFDASMPVCMIFGENGTGKSSIVDAIDFVCNGKYGSLEHHKLGAGQRKDRFLPSVGKRDSNVRVEIGFAGTAWSANQGPSGATLCATPNRPHAWILRRAELLGFVEAEPADRYRQLATYIAVQEIEQAEASLRDANNAIDRKVDEARRAKEQTQAALQDFWEREDRPAPSRDGWAQLEAVKDVTALGSSVKACQQLIESAGKMQTNAIARGDAQQRDKEAADLVANAEKALTDAATSFAAGATKLLQVLKDARSYLGASPTTEECPVCERPIDPRQLTPRLAERIADLSRLDELARARDAAHKAKEAAAAQLTGATQAFLELARDFAGLASKSTVPEVIALGIDWRLFVRLGDPQVPITDVAIVPQAQDLLKTSDRLQAAAKNRLDADQKTLNQLNAIKQHVQTIDTQTRKLADLVELQSRANETLRVVEDKRKSFVNELLRSVSGEVDGLYSRLHPGEAIGGLKIYLDPNQRGSLKFEGKFETEAATPPQAYYSESHLDTLGVCIFLALAKKFINPQSFVVLDDVFTSVDQVHLDRVVRLIHDEAEQLNHLVLTTHYRPWRDAYRYYRGPGLRIQLIELLPWTLQRGICHTKTKLVADELVEYLGKEPLDRQAIASKAGILLEGLLDHLTLLYECRVPRRADSRYTLGDLMDALGSKLKKALKVSRPSATVGAPAVDNELKPPLDEVASIVWIRNEVGCHFNLDVNTADRDVKQFAEKVRDLAEVMICQNCGELPRSGKTGSDRQCRCGQVRMLPVTVPD